GSCSAGAMHQRRRGLIMHIRHWTWIVLFVLVLAALSAPDGGWAGASDAGPKPSPAPPAPPTSGLPQAGRPLADLLNADGTLDLSSGYAGTLDPTGWRMETGAGGRPRFVPSTAGGQGWDPRFNPPGTDNSVFAVAISGTTTFIGGSFTTAGGIVANNIAAWDG